MTSLLIGCITLLSSGSFDREVNPNYHLIIKAVDSGTPPQDTSVNVHVHILDKNDNAPKFTEDDYNFVVKENQPKGTMVGQVRASDVDNGTHAQLTYTIDSNANSGHFMITPTDGVITTAIRLDREDIPLYRITVRVSDSAAFPYGLYNTTTVSITVLDLNDNSPSFAQVLYAANISENSAEGASVAVVTASDPDRDANARLAYSLATNGSAVEPFR